MNNPRIAKRYAVSLLRLATEQGRAEQVYQNMKELALAVRGNRDLDRMFRSPLIKADAKNRVLAALFGSSFDPLTLSFLELVVRKHREAESGGMAESYVELYERQQGTVRVRVTSAKPLDAANQEVLEKRLRTTLGDGVAFAYSQDPDLLGGYVIQSGDLRVDASLRRDLQQLRRQFSDNPYLQKF